MRWLLLKDLRLLGRSPLLVALLVLYPIAIAVLIGFALSRGPEKPRVAILNEVPPSGSQIELGGEKIDTSKQSRALYQAVQPVRVKTRRQAIQKVRDGDVLGALIIPPDTTQKLESGLEPATIQVFYNAEDPVKARFVQETIKAQVHDANSALTKRLAKTALDYLNVIVAGGRFTILGHPFDVLGLNRAEQVVSQAQRELPRGAPARDRLTSVSDFARLARDNLHLSNDLLAAVGSPIRVKQTALKGGATSLTTFAVAVAVSVSLMFITVLLAAGALALEREENAFPRLVRGLVSRSALLVEKAGLATVCAAAACLLMMVGLGLFVELDWGRFPLWVAGLAVGALAFAALGLAIGAAAREVRAASLLAFMLALPLAFLALVPSGAVAPGLFDLIRVVSALFPFKPTLQAMNAALNGSGGLAVPLLHLAALALAFGALGRLALRRFA